MKEIINSDILVQQDLKINVGDIFIIENNDTYRVLYVDLAKNYLTAINMRKDGFYIERYNSAELLYRVIEDRDVQLISGNYSIIASYHIDIDTENPIFIRNKDIIEAVTAEYGPDYYLLGSRSRKSIWSDLSKEKDLHVKSIQRVVIRFLKSGLKYESLMPQNSKERMVKSNTRRGRKKKKGTPNTFIMDKKAQQIISIIVKDYLANRKMSLWEAFSYMNNHYYKKSDYPFELLPESERPSNEQFKYWANKFLTRKKKEVKKTSEEEYRNDQRPLNSDTLNGVIGPGYLVEIDECECDFDICSKFNPDQNIGRAVMYLMVDVYSRAIIAGNIEFENNSVAGLVGLFLNLGEDKKKLCEDNGIFIDTEELWPSEIIPFSYRCDNGKEYLSEAAEVLCRKLKIREEAVPVRSGSFKGNIEQKFRQFNAKSLHHMKDAGLIEFRYDSNHRKTAVLNLDDARKVMINFIVHYNQDIIEDYHGTPDMILKKIPYTPINLWKYGEEKEHTLHKIVDRSGYFSMFLMDGFGYFSRKGVKFKGHYYDNLDNPEYYEIKNNPGTKSQKVRIKYDPRSNAIISARIENKPFVLFLSEYRKNQQDFIGLSTYEDNYYQEMEAETKAENEWIKDTVDASASNINEQIVENGKKRSKVYATSSNMKENRKFENEVTTMKNSTYIKLYSEAKRNITADSTIKETNDDPENDVIQVSTDSFTISDPIEEDTNAAFDNTVPSSEEVQHEKCEKDNNEMYKKFRKLKKGVI